MRLRNGKLVTEDEEYTLSRIIYGDLDRDGHEGASASREVCMRRSVLSNAPLGLLLVVVPHLLIPGGALPGQAQNAARSSSIRRVDFLNFTYPCSCADLNANLNPGTPGFPKAIRVRNGKWEAGSVGGNGTQIYFGVLSYNKIIYGDLTGDGFEEAVLPTACGVAGWELGYEEIFVYATKTGKPALLTRLKPPQPTTPNGIRIRNGLLLVEYYTCGSPHNPDCPVTARFRWNGRQLVQVGTTRRPNPPH